MSAIIVPCRMSGPAATRLKVSRPARREGHAASENVWALTVRNPLRSMVLAIFEARPFATVRDGLRRGCYTFQPIPTNFLGAVWPPRRLGCFARTVFQDTTHRLADLLHFNLSAGSAGLAARVGRAPTSQKETRKCPTMQWRNPT